jgi:hypothetical protein
MSRLYVGRAGHDDHGRDGRSPAALQGSDVGAFLASLISMLASRGLPRWRRSRR